MPELWPSEQWSSCLCECVIRNRRQQVHGQNKHRQSCYTTVVTYRAERNIAVMVKKQSNIAHRHAVQRKLAVHLELIGGRHPSTRVHQNIIELQTNSRGERNIFMFIVFTLLKRSMKMIHLNWCAKALQKDHSITTAGVQKHANITCVMVNT